MVLLLAFKTSITNTIKTSGFFRFRNRFSAYLTNHLLMENLNIYKIKRLRCAGEENLSFALQTLESDLTKLKIRLVSG